MHSYNLTALSLFFSISSVSALSAITSSLTRGSSGSPLLSAFYMTFAIQTLHRETSALESSLNVFSVLQLALMAVRHMPTELLSISLKPNECIESVIE